MEKKIKTSPPLSKIKSSTTHFISSFDYLGTVYVLWVFYGEGILFPRILTKYYLDQKHLVRATFLGRLGFPKANFGLNSGNPSSFPGGRLHLGDVFWGCKDSFVLGNWKGGSKEGEIANELPQLSWYILDQGVQGKTNAPSRGTEVPWYSFRLAICSW